MSELTSRTWNSVERVATAEVNDEMFASLDGQIGEAMNFVERLRNMIVHSVHRSASPCSLRTEGSLDRLWF